MYVKYGQTWHHNRQWQRQQEKFQNFQNIRKKKSFQENSLLGLWRLIFKWRMKYDYQIEGWTREPFCFCWKDPAVGQWSRGYCIKHFSRCLLFKIAIAINIHFQVISMHKNRPRVNEMLEERCTNRSSSQSIAPMPDLTFSNSLERLSKVVKNYLFQWIFFFLLSLIFIKLFCTLIAMDICGHCTTSRISRTMSATKWFIARAHLANGAFK